MATALSMPAQNGWSASAASSNLNKPFIQTWLRFRIDTMFAAPFGLAAKTLGE